MLKPNGKSWRLSPNIPECMTTAREYFGVLVKDLPRYLVSLGCPDNRWLGLCNRYERVEWSDDRSSVRCDWQWTSELHAPTVLPNLGRKLLSRALREHPICFSETLAQENNNPAISFIIGHRGMERFHLLQAVLETIAGQRDVCVECVVVDQSTAPEIRDLLPKWVRYQHTPPPYPEMPYVRAWAFNVGARLAQADLLVLHDNDLLVPADYARCLLDQHRAGYDVINIKRFIFYLGREDTARISKARFVSNVPIPESIIQNAQGGGSIAMDRRVYLEIGGYDETFVGWGGEDNEFWQRAELCRIYPYGYLPLIHLWHSPQQDKRRVHGRGLYTAGLYEERAALPPAQRIAELRQRHYGNPEFPTPLPAELTYHASD